MCHRFSTLQCTLFLLTAISASAAAPHLDISSIGPNRRVELTVHGDPGIQYSLQWSTNLSKWSDGVAGIADNTGSVTLQHDAAAFSTVFYRAKASGTMTALTLYPDQYRLNVDSSAGFFVQHATDPVVWTSNDPSIAVVDTNGVVTALAKGSVLITANSGAQSSSATVKIFQPTGPNADAYATELITDAFARNEITAEQELIYRAYANFGDSRLPAQFEGAQNEVGEPFAR